MQEIDNLLIPRVIKIKIHKELAVLLCFKKLLCDLNWHKAKFKYQIFHKKFGTTNEE